MHQNLHAVGPPVGEDVGVMGSCRAEGLFAGPLQCALGAWIRKRFFCNQGKVLIDIIELYDQYDCLWAAVVLLSKITM